MNRRTVLTRLGTALAFATGGCVQRAPHSGGSRGTAGAPWRLWFESVTVSASKRDDVDPLVFADLTTREQEIAETALDEGEYAVSSKSRSPAMERLRERIERRADGGLEVYFRRGDDYYRVGFAAGDHIIAHPTQ